MKHCVLMCLFLSIMSGCTLLVEKPVVTVKQIGLTALGADGVDLDLVLAVENPNSFPLTMARYRYDLSVQGIPFVSGGEQRHMEFAAHSATDLHLPVKVPVKGLLEILKQKPDPDRIPYALEAEIQVKTSLLTKVFPLKSTGTVALPKEYRPVYYLNEIKNLFNGGKQGGKAH